MNLPAGVKYFVLAGAMGLLAVILVNRYVATHTAAPPQAVMEEVAVAEVDIAPGTAITGQMLRMAKWPRDIVPPKAIRKISEADGRVAQMSISKGEVLLQSKLAPEGTAAGLGGLLDPNKLAVTLRVDDVSGVAGFINPGDRVDVLVEMAEPGTNEHFSKIILQNLKVMSKGQIWEQTAEKKPQVVNTVTVEATPEEAEVINLASFQGKVRLALRNQLNQAQFTTKGVVTSQLSRVTSAPVAPKAPGKKKQETGIEIIKGMKRASAEIE